MVNRAHLEELRNELRQRALEAVLSGMRWLEFEQLGAPSEVVQAWLDEGRLFAIEHQGAKLVPAYALVDGKPAPALQEILKLLAGRTPFQVAAWLESRTTYLSGKRPREMLAKNGQAVVQAVERSLGPGHG